MGSKSTGECGGSTNRITTIKNSLMMKCLLIKALYEHQASKLSDDISINLAAAADAAAAFGMQCTTINNVSATKIPVA